MSPAHHLAVVAFLFVLGAAVGSFLNVCIYRIPAGMSLVRPPSRCPSCSGTIAPRDNLPIVGWLLLKGRCRRCAAPISWRYPAVEALTGLVLAAAYLLESWAHGGDPFEPGALMLAARLLVALLVASWLLVAALIGYDDGRVPACLAVSCVLVGLVAGLLPSPFRPALLGGRGGDRPGRPAAPDLTARAAP